MTPIQRLIPFALALPLVAQAQLIRADSAVAGSEFSSNYHIQNAIDGTGMPPNFTTADLHAAYNSSNHWTTANGAIAAGRAWAEFSFNSAQTIGTFHMWNHQSNVIASNAYYAVTQFDLILLDSGGNTLASFLDLAAVGGVGNSAVQSYSFAQVMGVSKVRFVIDKNGAPNGYTGVNYTGLAEVAFGEQGTPPIPEPGTWALMAAGLVAVGAIARRRRAA